MQARRPDWSALKGLTIAAALALWALAGAPAHAASAPASPSPAASATADALAIEDPFESLNRRFYAIHRVLDRAILRTLALGYQQGAPRPLQAALHNVVTELGEPMVFANDVLQFRLARAAKTAARFVVNATAGIGGLFDPATKMRLEHHDNGFGDTLGRYGFKPGPYIFLPLVGPSTLRDLLGTAVDFYSDPLSRIHYPKRAYVQAGVWIVGGLDQRARAEADLQHIDEIGTDSYATLRSLYLQDREARIRGGEGVSIETLPSFDDAPAAPAAAPAARERAPAASDAAVSAPSSAVAAALPPDSGPDAAYFLTPPPPPPAPFAGPPLGL